jgi:hypothetical protein
LISDSPACLSQQLRVGNYQSLVLLPSEFCYFRNPVEYYVLLGRQLFVFLKNEDCFSRNLIEIAIEVFFSVLLLIVFSFIGRMIRPSLSLLVFSLH